MDIVYSFTNLLASIGLASPITRAAVLGGIGYATQYFFKPSISYLKLSSKTGDKYVPKEFAPFSKAGSSATTWVPWFMFPVIGAIIGGLFI